MLIGILNVLIRLFMLCVCAYVNLASSHIDFGYIFKYSQYKFEVY